MKAQSSGSSCKVLLYMMHAQGQSRASHVVHKCNSWGKRQRKFWTLWDVAPKQTTNLWVWDFLEYGRNARNIIFNFPWVKKPDNKSMGNVYNSLDSHYVFKFRANEGLNKRNIPNGATKCLLEVNQDEMKHGHWPYY